MKKIAEGFEEKYGIPFARFIDLDLTTKKKGKVSRGGTVTNPESYLLLNDPLLGRMDSTLMGGEGEFYRLAARRLAKNAKHPEFGYLFRSQAALARTLSRKADLTVRTRKAYLENDREAMGEILRKDYPYIQKNLKEFIAAFRALWLYDNNPQGLEVQEARLGGLRQRLESCEERLWDWVENNTRIPELEEEVLDIRGKGRDLVPGHFFFDTWVNVVSAGRT